MTLADIPPGSRARIDTLDGLSTDRRHQLQAYGVAPGRWVRVVQQSPVTVVRVEHLDLAFESDIARGIRVEVATPDTGPKKKLAWHEFGGARRSRP
jgi:Fe2+ transport system protein FeoA